MNIDNPYACIDDIAFGMEPMVPSAKVRLLETFGSAEAIYSASSEALTELTGLRPDVARNITRRRLHSQAKEECVFMSRHGICAVAHHSPVYPRLLCECPDYPPVLYVRGDVQALSALSVAMVGTRKPDSYGLSACARLVDGIGGLRPDAVVVSGLAYGVDVACHRAALAAGLRTVGVLANPLDMVYPSVHRVVAEDMIRRGGAVVSELSSRDTPGRGRFLQRNRIIAGMCAGTVVVQSPDSGGSMITASLADGYNRIVMAPPANMNNEHSSGTNGLIRRLKARMVCSGADILDELGWLPEAVAEAARPGPALPAAGDEAAVYGCICRNERLSLEELTDATGISFGELTGLLMNLEFEGFIRSLPGNRYEKF